MYLLDTDHISLLARGGAAGERIRSRASGLAASEIAVTIVSYEEQVRGWMAEIAAARSPDKQVLKYERLNRMLITYCGTPICPFDHRAAHIFKDFVAARLRIGTMDLKIAAIALANNAILLTRNMSHFEKVPGLRCENWAD